MSHPVLNLVSAASTVSAPSELLRSAVLGVVQGLTEFLPISSSAHLILFSKFAGWPDQGLAFDIAANTGTLVALLVYFRRDLWAILNQGLATRDAGRGDGNEARRPWPLLWWLAAATVPVAVFGLLGAEWIAREGRSAILIGTTSIVFGVLLWFADRRTKELASVDSGRSQLRHLGDDGAVRSNGSERSIAGLGLRDALTLGVAQAVALIPGTSRSGAVMTAGLFSNFDRTSAARLAFLMAIPVGVLVALKNGLDLLTAPEPMAWPPMLVGFVCAAVSGYVVVALLLEWLRHRGLGPFVAYRIVLGLALLWFELS